MTTPASIVIPTRGRPEYLEVALASIAPQARAAGAELLVIDDAGASEEIRALSARFGARYEPHTGPLGLNVARNTGVERSAGELVVFVDDDVEVTPGWLEALLRAAREHPETEVFTGPIRPWLQGGGPHSCGREAPSITSLELGEHDQRTRYAWGANMTVRRAALERVGHFDVTLEYGGDEQEWQDRLRRQAAASGDITSHGTTSGRTTSSRTTGDRTTSGGITSGGTAGGEQAADGVLYVAQAALTHRRTGSDARLRALARAARGRGAASRRFDAWRGEAPSLGSELRTLAGCVGHVVRRRCPAGLTMVAHSLGRLQQGLCERGAPGPVATSAARDDFLSGESGTVGGLDAIGRGLGDEALDAWELLSGRRLRLKRAAQRHPPRRRVLVLGVARPERRELAQAIAVELLRSRHEVDLQLCPPGALGKFENLNALLEAHPAEGHDWLVLIDDDITLPRGFLDGLLFLAERYSLDLAQPAHRLNSHAAWRVTRRQWASVVRETPFVEIGPVTAFARSTFSTLLPFPPLRMGWGLDLHWAALARERGWRCGVLDAVAIGHRVAPAAEGYSREAAVAEARAFLAVRPYLRADEAQRTLIAHRRWS